MRRKSRFNSDDCILKKRKEIQGNKSKKKQGGVLGMAVRKKAKLTIYGEKNMDEVAKELKRYAA